MNYRQLASTEQAAAQRQQEYETMINSLSANRVGSDADVIVAKQNEMKWKQKCQELIGKLDNEVSAYNLTATFGLLMFVVCCL